MTRTLLSPNTSGMSGLGDAVGVWVRALDAEAELTSDADTDHVRVLVDDGVKLAVDVACADGKEG